jgi:hypothetical protein
MTAAQKKAKDNFKKAIAYRKKTGCTLKQAFAHVYGKKVGAIKKKASPKKKAAKKKAAPKKKAALKKKAAARNYGSHKDTGSHNVRVSVVSGIDNKNLQNLNYLVKELNNAKYQYEVLKIKKRKYKTLMLSEASAYARYPNYIKGLKKQITEVKKHIK